MKTINTIIIFILLTSASYAQFSIFKPKAKPSPTPVVSVQERSKTPIQDAKQIIVELKSELNSAKIENVKLKNNLENANNTIKKGFDDIAKLNKDITTLKEWGVIQQAEAQKWLEKYTSAVKRYHRLKLIAAIIAAAGGVLLGLQFMNFVPVPYNLLVPVGSAALFATLIWMIF